MRPQQKFSPRESGATTPEYALMLGLIAGVIILSVAQVGTALNALFYRFLLAFP